MAVNSTHEDYDSNIKKWTLVRDCVAGASAVKKKGEEYLPNPDPTAEDKSKRYQSYLLRAMFINVTSRTKRAMVGMAFRKPPSKKEIPAKTEYLVTNATGDGGSLENLGKKTVGELLAVGRFGLLSDYPVAEDNLTQAQVRALNLQASIKTYKTETILDWDVTVVNGQEMLSFLKLKEDIKTRNSFETETKTQYRMLMLVDGVYTVEIWDESKIITPAFTPKDSRGRTLELIPFVIAGTDSNDAEVDPAALYDIAEINIGHYRNSADYEESCFLVGQPQPVITGLDQNWVDSVGGEYKYGSRNAWTLPVGASASILQVAPNMIAREGMEDKEDQMISIGAKVIDPDAKTESTATASVINHSADVGILANIVQNSSLAIKQSIEWCGLFMGTEDAVEYSINDDFYDKTKTAQDIMAEITLFDRKVIAKADLRNTARKAGIIELDRTDDDIDSEVDEGDPLE
ncbi:MAG: hypothetical protein DRH08_05260 [Deltaproteobacteria bacterium]|nr:MAG: hypothetical protein DRH08_05260 [Deltaproteobacteria bacterium]